MLAYYYHRPTIQSQLTDTLNVGNAPSEAAHHYQITGQLWHATHSYTYPGTADQTRVPPSFRTADPYRIFTGKDGIR
jgi:hypothetical protein